MSKSLQEFRIAPQVVRGAIQQPSAATSTNLPEFGKGQPKYLIGIVAPGDNRVRADEVDEDVLVHQDALLPRGHEQGHQELASQHDVLLQVYFFAATFGRANT